MSENLDLVRSIVAPWERGDYATVDWAHPAIDYEHADGPAPGSWIGVGGMAAGWREMMSVMTGHRVQACELRELDGARVLVLFHLRGIGKNSGLDLAKLHTSVASVFHLEDRKVTKLVNYIDSARALAELGLDG